MKKLLAVLLTGMLLIPGSLQTAYAEETNGVYEAENAKIEGKYQTLDWTTFQPIDVDPVEENANASGGKNVGYFGTVGNSITWTVSADAAGTADLTFVLASCINETDASWQFVAHKECPLKDHLEIKVNGTALDVTNKVVPAKKDATQSTYDYYQDVTFEGIALNNGDNTISITVVGLGSNPMSQETVNVDCLKVSNFTAGAAGGNGGNGGNNGNGGHNILRIEAEEADVVADLSSMSWMGVTSAVEEKASASGGKSIGYFGAVGNKITWKFDASAAGKATIELGLASGATDMTTFANVDMLLADGARITVNGKEQNCAGINLPAGNYENWTKVIFEADVVTGANEVVLEIIGSVAPNVDYMEVRSDGISFTSSANVGSNNGSANNGGSADGKGALRIEAENADVVADLSSMSWMGVTSAVEEKASASGGKSIGYFGAVGNKITWKFNASAAGKATIELGLASGATDMTTFANVDMLLADGARITVNGKEQNCAGINLPAGNYENWIKVIFEADVVTGANEVVLEIIGSVAPNVDYLEVSSDTITFTTTQTGASNSGNNGGNNNGNNSGNNFFPGNDNETNINGYKPNNDKSSTGITQQTVTKEPVEMVKDAIIGIIIACIFAFAGAAAAYVIYIRFKATEEEKNAVRALIETARERKEAWKKEYAALTDSEEKEISRVKFAMDKEAAKAARIAEIEKMTYGEGVHAMRAEKLADMATPKVKYILPLLIVATLIGGIIGANYVSADSRLVYATGTAGGKYTLVVEGYDWGPGIPKVVLQLDGKVKPEYLKKAKFDVDVNYQGWMGATDGNRAVTNMYLSDEKGNEVDKKSQYITLEFEVGPSVAESSPFFYDFMAGVNNWSNPYSYTIKLAAGSELVIDGKVYTSASIKVPAGKISPDADVFSTYSGEFEGITLSYAAYEPKKLTEDKVKNVLIIWLHGAGEGGTDPYIDILGNKVTALTKDSIQNLFDGNGAYVLAPQSPTMWMNDGSGEYTQDGTSMYLKSLKALIDAYVAQHDDIDTNRIIIGGCSNGGYMTMNMILTYPDYFAAAYPICEAYMDEWITDEMLNKIVNLPIWFTHAKADTTVAPDDYTVATYQRLIAAGAKNIHFSYYDDVRDTTGLYKNADGSAYVYTGHWSWIYTLNNDCKLDFDGSAVKLGGKEVTIWEWLAAQSR